jgi:NAD(P)-dependent dehydrogenase (short-subunit alcohol dehydrogenase family)
MSKIILITGASSGFGALSARALARAGHTVYAGMRATQSRNAPQVAAAAQYAADNGVDLRSVELDVQSDASVAAGINRVIADAGRIDVVVHNAGHMAYGAAEAFTAEQFADLYDINVLSAQRVNRAALPHMRKRGRGLLVWISSTSVRGGTPPYLAPYFAAKAAMDSMAVSYAAELARWGVETTIVVPGAFTHGTNHFTHAGAPADQARMAEYDDGPYAGLAEQSLKALAALEPADADVRNVAEAIVRAVDTGFGKRPFRVHIDPTNDGAEVVNAVGDHMRSWMLARIGLQDLLVPRNNEIALSVEPA